MLDILTVVKYNSSEEFTMEQMMNPEGMDQATYDRIFRSELYRNAMKTWIPFMHKRGLLDPVANDKEE
jgi:hypothetical protein